MQVNFQIVLVKSKLFLVRYLHLRKIVLTKKTSKFNSLLKMQYSFTYNLNISALFYSQA